MYKKIYIMTNNKKKHPFTLETQVKIEKRKNRAVHLVQAFINEGYRSNVAYEKAAEETGYSAITVKRLATEARKKGILN